MSNKVIGISFENIHTGEVRVAATTEHIAAFFNSSDLGPNSRNKQDFGWRLSPEDLIALEKSRENATTMERIAQVYQIPAEDVADYNILMYIARERFSKAQATEQSQDHSSDYEQRVRELRDGKKTPARRQSSESKKTATASDESKKTEQDKVDGGKIEESTKTN